MNPLNSNFVGKFNSAPFEAIKPDMFLPAIEEQISEAKSQVLAIASNLATPNFGNTVAALDYSGEQLQRVTSLFFNLNNAHTNETIQSLARKISPMLSELRNDILLNAELFNRIKKVYDQRDQLNLSGEEKTLLQKKYRSFKRNGADLDEKQKVQLRALDKELADLSLKFGENVLAVTQKFELHLTDQKQLAGLPDTVVDSARSLAEQKKKSGWIFTLDYPSYVPFMTYAQNRELRKKMSLAFGSRCYNNEQHDNQKTVLRIVKLRKERATLLGYESHAHFVLQERMAQKPEKVMAFLNDLLEKAKPAAQKEFEELQAFAKAEGIKQLQIWDSAYYAEKLKQSKFDLDEEKIKEYFELQNVIGGVFATANKLYGLNFEEVFEVEKYHEEVKTYQVKDENGEFVALFYADFHPRPGKRNGAWMTSFKSQYRKNGINERPHISIVCNFSRPTKNKPALLTFREVTTLFHEFGHALHGMMANTTYSSLSGTNVFWDFVELPSQIFENWCYRPETLALFAKHYETGEQISEEIIKKIRATSNFMEGMQTLRQLRYAILDMLWHGNSGSIPQNIKKFENEAFKTTQLFPLQPETCMSTSFAHIFQGGYSAGYYSYKWAEVLDADAFELFEKEGVFNQKIAKSFKENILSKGGSEDPTKLYVKFRGREPDPEALLRRAGLVKNSA